MNIRNWSGKRKAIVLMLALLIIAGLAVTVYLVQTQLETRSRAEAATVLSLTPGAQTVTPGSIVSLDVNIDPGVNQVDYVKFVINFDSTKFDTSTVTFTVDPDTNLAPTTDPVITDGQIAVSMNTGGDPTSVIQSAEKIGTIQMQVFDDESSAETSQISGQTEIVFDEDLTEIRSISSTDAYNENVLSSTSPATVNIEAVCRPDIATCTWDPVNGASSYTYVVTDIDADSIILEGTTSATFVEFSVDAGATYSCSVVANNDCGTGEAGEGSDTCGTPPISPAPTSTPSATPAPTVAPSQTPAPTNSPTPTPAPSSTPTPTPTSTPTPTPTDIPDPTPTEIVYEDGVSTPTPTYPVQNTPTPTIEDPGNPAVILGGIIGGVLVLLGGLALLAL